LLDIGFISAENGDNLEVFH